MRDVFAAEVAKQGQSDAIRLILEDVCRITRMGFAAVARVTEQRWITCQVLDQIEFGLKPGDELEVATTICNEIRASGQGVVIDHVADNPEWRTHPVPVIYGFESYASFPIFLDDGSFYGTLCAIDPAPRVVSTADIVAALSRHAREVARLLSRPAAQA